MENKNKSLTEQLKEHIDKIGEEAFEREIFEFNCEWHGVDPNAKNAKKKLKRIMWWEHFKYKTLPKWLTNYYSSYRRSYYEIKSNYNR